LAGWVTIPDNSTLGCIFRTFRERQVSQLEILNHQLRGKIWRKALKSGDAYTSNGVVKFTKQLLAHLPKSQTILFHGDSGFFDGKLFELLDHFCQGYLVKVKLKGLKELLFAQAWKMIPDKPGWEPSTVRTFLIRVAPYRGLFPSCRKKNMSPFLFF